MASAPTAAVSRAMIRRESVKKNVAAIHVSSKLTLLQRKLSNVLLLNAYDALLSLRTHKIDARTLCTMIGYNSNDMDTLKEALRSLVETSAEWDMLGDDGEHEWGVSALLASARLRGGVCEYAYSPALAEKLHDPKIFALINLSIQREFKSGHALALYENCFRFVRIGSTGWWDIELFRRLMGVNDSEYYNVFKHLNAKIIKPAVAEVNRVSNIRIKPEFRRRGRAVSEIRFSIREVALGPVLEQGAARASGDASGDEMGGCIIDRLASLGVSERLARQWVREHGAAQVAEKLAFVTEERSRGRMKGSTIGSLSAVLRDVRPVDWARNAATDDPAHLGDPAEAQAQIAAIRRAHRAACFDAVAALAAAEEPAQEKALRQDFADRIENEIDQKDFRARGWRSALNAAAVFAFWDARAPGALPQIEDVARALGFEWFALLAASPADADATRAA